MRTSGVFLKIFYEHKKKNKQFSHAKRADYERFNITYSYGKYLTRNLQDV